MNCERQVQPECALNNNTRSLAQERVWQGLVWLRNPLLKWGKKAMQKTAGLKLR
jgi:hypothetical protein